MALKIFLFFFFFLFYTLFRSIQYDVTEALPLEQNYFFSANHLLFRPIGYAVYKIAQAAGYNGRSVNVLQMVNIFCGAAGVTISFYTFQKLGAKLWAALAASFLLGTSLAYWQYSTSETYILMASTFAAAAILCSVILIEKRSMMTTFSCGFFFALATLTWQAAIFMFPVLLWPMRQRFREMVLFTFVSLLIIGGVYIAVGIFLDNKNITDLLRWASTYAGADLPYWGQMNLPRISLGTTFAAISIYQPFGGVQEFFRSPDINTFWPAVAAICFALLATVTLLHTILLVFRKNKKLIWVLIGYIIFFAFAVWWDPEIRWFLIANIYLCAAASLVWSASITRPYEKIMIFGTILLMATITFAFWIWPKHIDRGKNNRTAECIAKNIRSHDMVIAPDWNWPGDLHYFYKIEALQIIDRAPVFQDSGKFLNYLDEEIQKTHTRGGRSFIVAPTSYSKEYLMWLTDQTGFSETDFAHFEGRVAFQCEGLKFREVLSLN